MLRWIFGWGVNEQEKKTTQPAKRWVSDGKGGYMPSTFLAAATFAGVRDSDSDPSLDNQNIVPKPSSRKFPKRALGKPALSNDELPQSSALEYPCDALASYQCELQRTSEGLQASLAKWIEKKEEIIGSDSALEKYALAADQADASHPGKQVFNEIRIFFKHVFDNIKQDLQPANSVLHDLLDKAHDQVQGLCHHLDASRAMLDDDKKSVEEKNKIKVDMCNVGIEIVNDLILLFDQIQAEINYCVQCNKITEHAARELVKLLVLIIVKIPMPELSNLSLNNNYRYFLYNEIQGEKKDIEVFTSDVKGHLKQAMSAIQRSQKKQLSDSGSLLVFAPAPTQIPALTSEVTPILQRAPEETQLLEEARVQFSKRS